MAELKRDWVKYIRDGAKARYEKANECYICGTTEDLDFHHYSTISILASNWLRDNEIKVETAEDAFFWRDKFIEEHQFELYEDAITLCRPHHEALHKIYGKNPKLVHSKKQARWVQRQRDKHRGMV